MKKMIAIAAALLLAQTAHAHVTLEQRSATNRDSKQMA